MGRFIFWICLLFNLFFYFLFFYNIHLLIQIISQKVLSNREKGTKSYISIILALYIGSVCMRDKRVGTKSLFVSQHQKA